MMILRCAARLAQRSFSAASEGPVAQRIRAKLTEQFKPTQLSVECESHKHNVPKGSEMHFKVSLHSAAFEGLSLLQRHRLVNGALAAELSGPVHALAIHAFAASAGTAEPHASPACRGGAGL